MRERGKLTEKEILASESVKKNAHTKYLLAAICSAFYK